MNSFDASPPDRTRPAEPTTAEEVEALSLQLDAQMSQGQAPNLQDWLKQLERVPEDQRQALLERFTSLAAKFTPKPTDSQTENAHGVDRKSAPVQEFLDSRIDNAASRETDAEQPTADFHRPARKLGNYDLLNELGKGGMGVVYRARHIERDEVVALKVLPNVDGKSLHRFKREFRSLADMSHPNLVGLRTLEAADGTWLFTMDLVENARTFRDFVRPSNQLDEARLRHCLAQLVEGVHTLHTHEVIHRDLKPSNVLVDADGRVVIMDFGLVRELSRIDQTVTVNDVAGTPAYMAPESVVGGQDHYAADWYAVGVMLYEALKGELPFCGDALKILSDKRAFDAPLLPEMESIPEDLRRIATLLLDRDPQRRPSHEEICEIVGSASMMRGATRRAEAHQELLLGREWHLATLRSHYEHVHKSSRPTTVFVSGMSGEGKSFLVERFLDELRVNQNITLLAGRCYDRESVPFKALDSLIDALASYLKTLDPTTLALMLPDDTNFLAQVFPVLGRVEVVAAIPDTIASGLDQKQIRKRAFSALRKLLDRICNKTRLVLFCDDLQWGDADSAEALFDVLAGRDAPKLLFIGSYRVDEAEDSLFLNAWSRFQQQSDRQVETAELSVGPLTLEHCTELVRQGLQSIDPQTCEGLARDLLEETGGNAFFLNELLQCLDGNSHQIRRIPLSEVIARKLSELPTEASELLQTIAVSGQALDIGEVVSASGGGPNAFATLTHMRNVRLVRLLGEESSSRIDTYHDKIRETILSRLDPQARRKKHRDLLDVLERAPNAIALRVYDLAYHADACQDQTRAFRFAMLAAQQARQQLAPEVAMQQFEIAYRNSDQPLNQPGSFELAEGYAGSLLLVGRYEDAQKVLDEADGCTSKKLELARIEEFRGEIAFKLGRPQIGLEHFRRGLAYSGLRVPGSLIGRLVDTGWHFARISLRSLFPRRVKKTDSPDVKASIRLLVKMEEASAFVDGTVMLWSGIRGISFSSGCQPSPELAFSCTMFGGVAAALGFHGFANRYTQKAEEISNELNDDWGVGHAKIWGGLNAFARADYLRSVALLEAGTNSLIKLGDQWVVDLGFFHLACSLFQLGRLSEAIDAAHRAFERSLLHGDTRAHCSLYLLSKASEGRIDFLAYEPHVKRASEDILATCNFYKGSSIWHLANGRFGEAIHDANIACELPLKSRLPNYHSAAGAPVALAARRRFAESLERGSAEFARALKSARKLAWRAVLIGRFFPVEYAFALRECGEVNRLAGKHANALKYFDKSIRVAKKQSAIYELAKTELARGKLLVMLQRPGADAELARAEAEMLRFSEMIDQALRKLAASE